MEVINLEEVKSVANVLRGLDHTHKLLIYEILCKKREATISEIRDELKQRFGIKLKYQSIVSLLHIMMTAGIVDIVPTRPMRVVLKKIVNVEVKDV